MLSAASQCNMFIFLNIACLKKVTFIIISSSLNVSMFYRIIPDGLYQLHFSNESYTNNSSYVHTSVVESSVFLSLFFTLVPLNVSNTGHLLSIKMKRH